MGNSASSGFITSTPRKLCWGRKREDAVKLEDFLTKCEEDLWGVKAKRGVKKVYVARSISYMDLGGQQSAGCFPHGGEMLNPTFVGDQGLWGGSQFTADSQNWTRHLSRATLCGTCTWAQLFKRLPFSPQDGRCEARLASLMCERALSSVYKKRCEVVLFYYKFRCTVGG